MTQDYGASVREWTDVVRRARLGRTVKGVAMVLVTYADGNGRRIFPGVGRLAVDAEVTYNVAQDALKTLRQVGLIERVSYGTRRNGAADEYRLILHADVLDRIKVLSPDEVAGAIDRHRAERSGGRRASDRGGVLHPSGSGAKAEVCTPADGVQDEALHPSGSGADGAPAESFAPHGDVSNSGFAPHGDVVLHPTPCPPTNHYLDTELLPTTPMAEVRTDLAVARASPGEEPDHPLPPKCVHGFRPRHRDDGQPSCPLCRKATVLALEHPSAAFRIIQGGASA